MHPLVGLTLSGASLTPFDDFGPGEGALGKPVWGPGQLLGDLELRLGIKPDLSSEPLRVTRWAERMAGCTELGRFYSRSFAVDPLGTARAVLDLRDQLVGAGWRGQPIVGDGVPLPRLNALAELEQSSSTLPPGTVDRVAVVARTLDGYRARIYDALTLAEPPTSWSGSWQEIFRALEKQGTSIEQLTVTLPGAAPTTDLGRVQEALAGEKSASGTAGLGGDGTLLLVTAETSTEAAALTAAMLANLPPDKTVVIREAEVSSIEHALGAQRLPTQGHQGTSPWRPMLQVLPLALELAFEPKDPRRVLDLLGLAEGPFAGAVGRRLRGALSRFPGIGGRAWLEAKDRIEGDQSEWLAVIAAWLEAPGADPTTGARKADLLDVIARVRAWLVGNVSPTSRDPVLLAAIERCDDLAEVLEAEPRSSFDRVSLRRVVELVQGDGTRVEAQSELAGRAAHVDSPSTLWVPRATVVWWSFTRNYEVARLSPWTKRERLALERVGIRLPDPAQRLLERAEGYRRAVRAATERLILVAPVTATGQRRPAHPLWDEIVGRLDLKEADITRLTRTPTNLLAGDAPNTPRVSSVPIQPLSLPQGDSEWSIAVALPQITEYSATKLATLLGCPLRWVLENTAGLRTEHDALPALDKLSGDLGHRLVEELFLRGAFDLPEAEFRALAEAEIDTLFEREGAVLLESGKAHEREHLRRVLLDAAATLLEGLRRAGYSITSVEAKFKVPWLGALLDGRWDLLVQRESGERVLIDLKWGKARYREALRSGQALQLAAYAYAVGQEGGHVPADYYSLKARTWFGLRGHSGDVPDREIIEGELLEKTWQRAERTVPLAMVKLQNGAIPVTGVRRSLPLLDALGIAEAAQETHFAGIVDQNCKYCAFDGLCGRRWEEGGVA